MMRAASHRAQAAAVAALAVAAALPSYWHGFVWDDVHLIQDSDFIRSRGPWQRVLMPDYWRRQHFAKGATYRPLPEIWFIAAYAFHDADPRVFHLANIGLHALACVGVYAAARALFAGCGPAFAIAALFALHPVHVEAVAWVKNVAVLWAMAFALAAFACYVRAARAWPSASSFGFGALGLVCFACGCASMEAGLLIVGGMLLYAVLGPKRGWPAFGWFVVFALAAVGVRGFEVWVERGGASAADAPAKLSLLRAAPIVFAEYCRSLLLPISLNADRHLDFTRWKTLAGALGIIVALGCGVAYVWRWRGARLAALWMLMGVAPFCAVGAVAERPFAEQRAYFASIGACALIAFVFLRLSRRPQRALLVLALAAWAALSVQQCLVWQSEATLWRWTVPRSPRHYRPWFNLSTVYASQRRLGLSEWAIRRALERRPLYPRAYDGLGRLAQMRGTHDAAVAQFRKAVEIGPRFAYAWNNLGVSLAELGRRAEALDAFSRALNVRPGYKQAHLNRGKLYQDADQADQALADFAASLGLSPPQDAKTHCAMGDICRVQGRLDQAVEHYHAAARLDPTYAPARAQLAGVQYEQGDAATAVGNYWLALELDPDLPRARYSFGLALASLGLRRAAAVQIKQALRLSPEIAELDNRAAVRKLKRLLLAP